MSCGLPTIASWIGGLTQIIEDGETGLLVDERDPKQIAKALIRLQNNDSERYMISQQARQYVIDNHSHKSGAAEYLKQFRT